MYGTVAKMRIKPGAEAKLIELTRSEDMTASMPGYISTTVYKLDSDPNDFIMVVLFEDKESYTKNADSPEQDARYREFVQYLEGAPQWQDGEVVYRTGG
jgi:heme-degrading monooxygenase HmoA